METVVEHVRERRVTVNEAELARIIFAQRVFQRLAVIEDVLVIASVDADVLVLGEWHEVFHLLQTVEGLGNVVGIEVGGHRVDLGFQMVKVIQSLDDALDNLFFLRDRQAVVLEDVAAPDTFHHQRLVRINLRNASEAQRRDVLVPIDLVSGDLLALLVDAALGDGFVVEHDFVERTTDRRLLDGLEGAHRAHFRDAFQIKRYERRPLALQPWHQRTFVGNVAQLILVLENKESGHARRGRGSVDELSVFERPTAGERP